MLRLDRVKMRTRNTALQNDSYVIWWQRNISGDICKCVSPGITSTKTHNQLAGMGHYMACHHNKVAYNCTQPVPPDIAFLAGRSSA